MTRVLVVEDNGPTRALIERTLEREGLEVEPATDGAAARAAVRSGAPDLVILDVGLPDVSGFELLAELRTAGLPVIVLTARGEEVDRVVGLELGAEDYVVKPFFPRELAARVRAVLRRSSAAPARRLQLGDLVVDTGTREVEVRGEPVELTAREFDLLAHLASAPRKVFTRDDLLRDVWRSSAEWQSPRTVTEHVRRLRQKLEQDPARPRRLVTVAGVGYRLDP